MKKNYITPKIKAVKVQASAIICTSSNNMQINWDDPVSEEPGEYEGNEGYGVAW